MSHHLVTACMFCLLCAAHTCGSHIDTHEDISAYEPKILELEHTVLEDKRKLEPRHRYHQKLQKIRHKDRTKREVKIDPTNDYVERIFTIYGDPESNTMNMTGFKQMLEALNLHRLVEGGKEDTTEKNSGVYGAVGTQDEIVNVSGIHFIIFVHAVKL